MYVKCQKLHATKDFFTNNMPEDDRCIRNLHEQFASAADLQELCALTVDKKKYIVLLY